MRYSAPPHVSDVTLSTGPIAVQEDDDGRFVIVPDDRSDGDHVGLTTNGFRQLPDDSPPATDGLDLKIADLRVIAAAEEVDLTGLTTKGDIQNAIRAKRALALAGTEPAKDA